MRCADKRLVKGMTVFARRYGLKSAVLAEAAKVGRPAQSSIKLKHLLVFIFCITVAHSVPAFATEGKLAAALAASKLREEQREAKQAEKLQKYGCLTPGSQSSLKQ